MAKNLEVQHTRDGDVGILVVNGEVQMEVAPHLHEAGERLLADGARHLLVDLRRVVFIDSASLAALIQLDGLCKKSAGKLVLIHVPNAVDRVIHHSGLEDRFTQAADEAEARSLLD